MARVTSLAPSVAFLGLNMCLVLRSGQIAVCSTHPHPEEGHRAEPEESEADLEYHVERPERLGFIENEIEHRPHREREQRQDE